MRRPDMKKISLFFLLLGIFSKIFPETSMELPFVSGNLREYTVIEYEIRGGSNGLEKIPAKRSVTYFDTNGRWTNRTVWLESLAVLGKVKPVYNRDGRLSGTLTYSASGILKERSTNFFDENGNVKERNVIEPFLIFDNITVRELYERDKQGNPVSWTLIGPDHQVEDHHTISWNSKNLLDEETCAGSEGKLIYRYKFDYNDAGAMTGFHRYGPNGELIDRSDYVLDSRGNCIESSHFDMLENHEILKEYRQYRYVYQE